MSTLSIAFREESLEGNCGVGEYSGNDARRRTRGLDINSEEGNEADGGSGRD